jgi:hypothetical protein
MIPLALAVSLFFADAPAVEATASVAAPAAETASAPVPPGAPSDDYQFVAWCYGVLSGYLELHDQVMPEVTRIESSFRRPGTTLADDLKVYDAQQKQGRADLKRFQAALTAAEKASVKPINTIGAAALKRGRSAWNVSPDVSKARLAEEWMSWTLPARCPQTAAALEKRSKLLGVSLQANADEAATAPAEPAPAPAETPAPAAAAAPESGKN